MVRTDFIYLTWRQ